MGDKLVGLVRVSTDRQGESGLGLEAQQAAIEAHCMATGGTLMKCYLEVESGMHDDILSRPQLRAAIAHARRAGAVLVVGKIDRLVRSTVVMAYLKTSGVRFRACDNPHANELTVDILVAVAANEGRAISVRVTEALKAYKAGKRISKRVRMIYPDGVPDEVVEATAGKLGASLPQCRNLTHEARVKGNEKSAKVRAALALDSYSDIAPWMHGLRAEGMTLQGIADRLTLDGHTTRRGLAWNKVQVSRVLGRHASD